MKKLDTPILLVIFNKPEYIKRIIEVLREVKVEQLYVIADGPRDDNDTRGLDESKQLISDIDWDCEIVTDYNKENQGPRKRLATGISWFFEHVEEGIILEHDCLPHSSFFSFCQQLLERYRDNNKIMHISGNNFLFDQVVLDKSYYFSKIPHIWGWATWKRAWQQYDEKMSDFPKYLKKNRIENIFQEKIFQDEWLKLFQRTFEGEIETWDYQWTYAIFKNNGLAVNPRVNLVSNIGFGAEAQNTTDAKSKFADMKIFDIGPITHPENLDVNVEADSFVMKNNFGMSRQHLVIKKITKPWRWLKYTVKYYLGVR